MNMPDNLAANPPTHCAACGNPLIGMFYTMVESEESFCHTCFHTRPRCDSCGVPLAPNYWQLHDGRLHCLRCHTTAIYDITIAQAVYDETIAGVSNGLHLSLNVGVEFRMIDAPTLRDLRKRMGLHITQSGMDIRTLGLYQHKGRLRAIYLLYGLPRLTFRTTVAHEYAHAWQTENCPLLKDYMLIEGFAEWVAFYHLLWLGATRAARRMLNANHPYRPALERLFEIEQQVGRKGVIEYMKRAE